MHNLADLEALDERYGVDPSSSSETSSSEASSRSAGLCAALRSLIQPGSSSSSCGCRGWEVDSAEPALQLDPAREHAGWGLRGEELHHKVTGVPPHRWCVTKEDLRYLRREIHWAVRRGDIEPHERDPFDPHDNVVGPNMYTVVSNFIKPLTAKAGNMSWALMRHPEGIQCDIFITHAWAEGVYEFIDKVLASWPREKTGAWCCVLANPQNLDISEFIKEPRTSPFAQALAQASHVMVVSNKKLSIYTRIWCVYEAWLAYSWNKVIFTATTPSWHARLLVFAVVLAVVVLTAVKKRLDWALCALMLGSVLAGGVLHCGHVWLVHQEREALLNRFTSIEEAESTSTEDKVAILRDISDSADRVARSINVLIQSGMSTPRIREAVDLGANINGVYNPMVPWVSLTFWGQLSGLFLIALALLSIRNSSSRILAAANPVLMVICMGSRHVADMDDKAFIRSVVVRVCVLMFGACCVHMVLWQQMKKDLDQQNFDFEASYQIDVVFLIRLLSTVAGLGMVVAVCSVLGLKGVARVPCIGPWLLWTLAPGLPICRFASAPEAASTGEMHSAPQRT